MPPKGSADSRDCQASAVEAQVAQALASRAFEQSSPRTSPRTRDDWGKLLLPLPKREKAQGRGRVAPTDLIRRREPNSLSKMDDN